MNYTYFETIPSEVINIIFSYTEHSSIFNLYEIIKHFYSAEQLFIYKYPLLYKDIIKVIPDDIRLNDNKDKWIKLYYYTVEDNNNLISSPDQLTVEIYVKHNSFQLNIVYRSYISKYYNDLYKEIIKYESFSESLPCDGYMIGDTLGNFPWNSFCKLLTISYSDKPYSSIIYLNMFYNIIFNQSNILNVFDIFIKDTKFSKYMLRYMNNSVLKKFINNPQLEEMFKYFFKNHRDYPYFLLNDLIMEVYKQDKYELFSFIILEAKHFNIDCYQDAIRSMCKLVKNDKNNKYLKFLEDTKDSLF